MPNWNQILDEIKKTASVHDATRRRYLTKLHKQTGRNTFCITAAGFNRLTPRLPSWPSATTT